MTPVAAVARGADRGGRNRFPAPARAPRMVRRGLLPVLVLLAALPGAATPAAMPDDEFAACVADLRQEAERRGVSPAVVEDSLADVRYAARVIELDRAQPEFVTTFADYLEASVTEARVERGRRLLEEHRGLLERIYREYGVPPRYLVAFWGLETNYGAYFGRMPVLDSLATLACDQRRSAFFRGQLLAALQLIDTGSMDAAQMQGSWAGAMGHVQFMPSAVVEYAVDYDGDGRRDLWGSLADAMASAANLLRAHGWETGWRWGREVQLPEGFPYELAGGDRRRPLTVWKALGVRDAYGRPLSGAGIEAALLVPAGHHGPAFLVYDNFDVIMQWNRSQYYALAVGRLADRLAGAAALRNPPPADAPRLARDQVIALQERLEARGFDPGPADGIPGPRTRAAISRFQQAHGMIADGFPSRALLAKLELQVAEAP